MYTCTVYVSMLSCVGQHWLSWLSGYTLVTQLGHYEAGANIPASIAHVFLSGCMPHQSLCSNSHIFTPSHWFLLSPLISPPSICLTLPLSLPSAYQCSPSTPHWSNIFSPSLFSLLLLVSLSLKPTLLGI